MRAANPKVIAAGYAAASWIRARRVTWDDPRLDLYDVALEDSAPEDVALEAAAIADLTAADVDAPRGARDLLASGPLPAREHASPARDIGPDASIEIPTEQFHHSDTNRAWARSLGSSLVRWLPLAGVALALLGTGTAGRAYWNKRVATPKTGIAVLESVPTGSEVLVDGRDMGSTPLTSTLSAGAHTVEFRIHKTSRVVQLAVNAGGRVVERLDWTMKPMGRLQVSSEPNGARVLVDGTLRGTTPVALDDVAAGAHAVRLESPEGSIQRSVRINANETTEVAERIFSGWLAVLAPFPVAISEGTQAIRLDDRNQAMLPPGPHDLRFENRALGYHELRRVDVRPGEITSLSMVAPRSALSVSATMPANVWVDGVRIDHTPLVDVPVDLGTREIVVRSASGDERRFTVTVTAKPVALNVDFSKPAF